MDRFTNVILFGGLGCFALAFALSAVYPYMITDATTPETSIVELAKDVPAEFRDLKSAYPVAFGDTYPSADQTLTLEERLSVAEGDPRLASSEGAWQEAYAKALRDGRNAYISEVCWHCHSQYVRPVANEAQRFGPVLLPDHDNNELQRPVMWGTRRVGPDLTHEGRKRSNDWHMAHLWNPASVSPGSVMPRYSWLFHEGWQVRRRIDPDKADRAGLPLDRSYPVPGVYDTREQAEAAMAQLKQSLPPMIASEGERLFVAEGKAPDGRALSLVAYLQWLGTWTPPHLESSP